MTQFHAFSTNIFVHKCRLPSSNHEEYLARWKSKLLKGCQEKPVPSAAVLDPAWSFRIDNIIAFPARAQAFIESYSG